MAEVTRERRGQLVRKVFEILASHPEGLPAREVIARVEKEIPLSAYEASDYETRPGVRRFEKILRFATIPLVKAGWLIKQKGQWFLSDSGRLALERHRDADAFMREAIRIYREWRRAQPEDDDEVDSESAEVATTLEEAEESAWTEIESYLARINPYELQDLVAGLLRGMKYHVSWVAPAGPDRGVDIIAHKDPLGVERGRIKVQVKRKADAIPVGEVRSFMALLSDEDVGIFVTLGGFTRDAETEARTQEKRRIMLVNARTLLDLWIEHYDDIPEPARRLLPLRPVYFLAPSE